ncbi:hypothetical protein KI387_044083, partial [Taxus chinensis]
MVYRPKVPDNVEKWQNFNDEKQISAYMELDEFDELYFERSKTTTQKTTTDEIDPDYDDSSGIIQLKGNKIPKGLVFLEDIFDKHDQYLKKNKEYGEISSSKLLLVNLGKEDEPKIVNLGKCCSRKKYDLDINPTKRRQDDPPQDGVDKEFPK